MDSEYCFGQEPLYRNNRKAEKREDDDDENPYPAYFHHWDQVRHAMQNQDENGGVWLDQESSDDENSSPFEGREPAEEQSLSRLAIDSWSDSDISLSDRVSPYDGIRSLPITSLSQQPTNVPSYESYKPVNKFAVSPESRDYLDHLQQETQMDPAVHIPVNNVFGVTNTPSDPSICCVTDPYHDELSNLSDVFADRERFGDAVATRSKSSMFFSDRDDSQIRDIDCIPHQFFGYPADATKYSRSSRYTDFDQSSDRTAYSSKAFSHENYFGVGNTPSNESLYFGNNSEASIGSFSRISNQFDSERPMKSGSNASLARSEQSVEDITKLPSQFDDSEYRKNLKM